jgi:hypothetical protein
MAVSLRCWSRVVSIAWALALLASVPVHAQAPVPSGETPLSLSRFGFRGTAIVKNIAYFADTPNDDRNFYNEGILQLEWARRLAPWFDAKVVGEARADDNNFADGLYFDVPDDNTHRSYLALKEAVLGLQKDPLRLTIGKQVFAWGTADGYNPTDNLNPYDYMDPIDREKLAVYSGATQLTAGRVSLTAVLVPLFTPSRVPLTTSRWFPPVPESLTAITASRELPPNILENMQYAARLRGTVAGWDLSVSYFEGFESTPVIKQTTITVAPGVESSRLTPVFTRMRVAGFDFSTTFGKLEVHGEAAAKFVVRDGRDDRLQWIAGINYAWDELELSWLERIHVIVEYSREEVIGTDSHSEVLPLNEQLALPNNGFTNAAIGRLLFHFSEATQLEVGGTVNFVESTNYYAKAALTHKITDALHVTVGVDVFDGARDTFWGRWRDNNRVYSFLRYFF